MSAPTRTSAATSTSALHDASDHYDTSSKKRAQVKLACNQCRSRKTKCSGGHPCNRCSQDSSSCTYDGRSEIITFLRQDRATYKAALSRLQDMLQDGDVASLEETRIAAISLSLQSFLLYLTHDHSTSEGTAAHVSEDSRMQDMSTSSAAESVSNHEENHSMRPDSGIWHWLLQRPRNDEVSTPNYPGSPSGATTTHYGNLPMSSAIKTAGYPRAVQEHQLRNFAQGEHCVRTLYVLEDSRIDNLFSSFHNAAIESLSKGGLDMIGGPDVDVELFFRDRQANGPHDIYTWACEIIKTLHDFEPALLLAVIWNWSSLLRWILLPTADNYAMLPKMIRPSTQQRMVPHPLGIDLEPHFAIRQALLERYRDWIEPGSKQSGAASLSWPYPLERAVYVHPTTKHRCLTSEFITHAADADNWTMKESVRKLFPEIGRYGFRFRPDGEGITTMAELGLANDSGAEI